MIFTEYAGAWKFLTFADMDEMRMRIRVRLVVYQ